MDHKREDLTPPLARVMGVGRQQQVDIIMYDQGYLYVERAEKHIGNNHCRVRGALSHGFMN